MNLFFCDKGNISLGNMNIFVYLKEIAFIFIVLYDDKRINEVLLYYNDITTTKLNSKKNVTRFLVLEFSRPYIPGLAAVCSRLIMRRSTHILLVIGDLLYFVIENFYIIYLL